MTPQDLQRRYRWQCRRGASEVEGVLNAYLERCFLAADATDQALFARLLSAEDVDMLDWFTGHARPDDPELSDFVTRLLDHVAAPH